MSNGKKFQLIQDLITILEKGGLTEAISDPKEVEKLLKKTKVSEGLEFIGKFQSLDGFSISIMIDLYACVPLHFENERVAVDFRWDDITCLPSDLLKGLQTFNKVICGLPQEVNLRPVKHFCGVAFDTKKDSPVLVAFCNKPGLYRRPSSMNQLWAATPEKLISWASEYPKDIIKDSMLLLKACNTPAVPVESVIDTWNTKFGKATGILFPSYTSWDSKLTDQSGTLSISRGAMGYQFYCKDLRQELFDGVQTLLKEFPKLEIALRPTVKLLNTELVVESDVELG